MTRHKRCHELVEGLSMLILLVLMLLLAGQTVYAQGGTQTANTSALLSTSLQIDGMVWPICERTAESVLGRLDGVVAADADFRTGRAVVTYDPAQTSPEQIVQAFNSQSFYRARVAAGEGGGATAGTGTLVLSVPALTDQAAAQQVVQALEPFQGAILDGSLSEGQITIEYDPAQVKAAQLVEAINQSTPYEATITSLTGPEAQPASSSGAADVIYTAIGYGKYVLWGLVGLALVLLGWRVVGRRLARVQVHSTER